MMGTLIMFEWVGCLVVGQSFHYLSRDDPQCSIVDTSVGE